MPTTEQSGGVSIPDVSVGDTRHEVKEPWHADFANFIVGKYLPADCSYHKRRKLFNDLKHYFWDDRFLYRIGPDGIIRKCVPDHEMHSMLLACHDSPYGGHHAGDRTAAKVLQSGFYWPTLFKDARNFVKNCDACQRIGNIGKRQEMAMNYNLVIEPFDIWRMDYMGPFVLSNGFTHILVAVDYLLNG